MDYLKQTYTPKLYTQKELEEIKKINLKEMGETARILAERDYDYETQQPSIEVLETIYEAEKAAGYHDED